MLAHRVSHYKIQIKRICLIDLEDKKIAKQIYRWWCCDPKKLVLYLYLFLLDAESSSENHPVPSATSSSFQHNLTQFPP